MRPGARLLAWASAALPLLGGCHAVGPDYRAPDLGAPAAYRHPAPPAAETAAAPRLPDPGRWWSAFGDPGLDDLEETALARSPTLASAAAAVAVARAQLRTSQADRLPSVTLNASAQLAGETATQQIPIGRQTLSYRIRGQSYEVPLDASYEFDLWGRVRREIESSGAQLAASEADLRSVALTLTAQVAQTYFQWRATADQMEIVRRTIAFRQDTVQIFDKRYRAQLIDALDLASAREQLADAQADLADLERQHEEDEDALATLTGRPPSDLVLGRSEPLPAALPAIPAGLPADLLRRRPDLVEAERTLAARTADVGVAQAAKYPTIKLTGSAGFESLELRTLISQPAELWGIGPSVTWPVFDGGRNDAAIAAARARVDGAVADYRGQALTAFREVEDALVDLRLQREQALADGRAVAAAQETAELSRLRYQHGLINYLDVATAENDLLAARNTQVQIQEAQILSTIALIKSLGGGWN